MFNCFYVATGVHQEQAHNMVALAFTNLILVAYVFINYIHEYKENSKDNYVKLVSSVYYTCTEVWFYLCITALSLIFVPTKLVKRWLGFCSRYTFSSPPFFLFLFLSNQSWSVQKRHLITWPSLITMRWIVQEYIEHTSLCTYRHVSFYTYVPIYKNDYPSVFLSLGRFRKYFRPLMKFCEEHFFLQTSVIHGCGVAGFGILFSIYLRVKPPTCRGHLIYLLLNRFQGNL